MPSQPSTNVRTRPDDCALLLRARRMAQRSRAATACLPCKANKSRCSDYRPCARCKKIGTIVCTNPQPESIAEIEARPNEGATSNCAFSRIARLRSDFFDSNYQDSCMAEGASPHSMHRWSDIAPLDWMPADLQRKILPTDGQVTHLLRKIGFKNGI